MSFFSKKISSTTKHDSFEINNFYIMLLKMKKRRPHMDINWIMTGLYGKDYINHIKS